MVTIRANWQVKGQWQDAYKPYYEGFHLYIKWKVVETNDESVLVLSFKEGTDKGL